MNIDASSMMQVNTGTARQTSMQGAAEQVKGGASTGVAETPASQGALNLTPGMQVRGTILDNVDGTLTLKLSGGGTISAKAEGMDMPIGASMNFEVRGASDTQVSLTPLLTNLGKDNSLLKALSFAGLPADARSIAMTDEMMKQGMNIGPKNLQEMMQEVLRSPQAPAENIVQMKALSLPITPQMAEAYEALKNQTMQLVDGYQEIADGMTSLMQDMAKNGEYASLGKLFSDIVQTLGLEEGDATNLAASQGETLEGASSVSPAISEEMQQDAGKIATDVSETSRSEVANAMQDPGTADESVSKVVQNKLLDDFFKAAFGVAEQKEPEADSVSEGNLSEKLQELAKDALALKGQGHSEEAPMQETARAEDTKQGLADLQRGDADLPEKVLAKEETSGPATKSATQTELPTEQQTQAQIGERLARLLREDGFSGEFSKLMAKKLFIKPEDLSTEDAVKKLYERVLHQARELEDVLQKADKGDSNAAKSLQNMERNVDFLNELNQNFAYVMLPLKMSEQNAKGDLYVYTNKKHLAQGDGTVTAMLHLGMDHLGDMDIYVALKENQVSTKFYLESEDVIDFLEGHMEELDGRLMDKGYSLHSKVYPMDHKEEGSPFDEMLKDAVKIPGIHTSNVCLSRQSFEVLV